MELSWQQLWGVSPLFFIFHIWEKVILYFSLLVDFTQHSMNPSSSTHISKKLSDFFFLIAKHWNSFLMSDSQKVGQEEGRETEGKEKSTDLFNSVEATYFSWRDEMKLTVMAKVNSYIFVPLSLETGISNHNSDQCLVQCPFCHFGFCKLHCKRDSKRKWVTYCAKS